MFPADKQNKTQNHEPSYLLKKNCFLGELFLESIDMNTLFCILRSYGENYIFA